MRPVYIIPIGLACVCLACYVCAPVQTGPGVVAIGGYEPKPGVIPGLNLRSPGSPNDLRCPGSPNGSLFADTRRGSGFIWPTWPPKYPADRYRE